MAHQVQLGSSQATSGSHPVAGLRRLAGDARERQSTKGALGTAWGTAPKRFANVNHQGAELLVACAL